jgi:hypothetical protein
MTKKSVRLGRSDGQWLFVRPACEAILGRILQTRPWHSRKLNGGLLRAVRERERLYELAPAADPPFLICRIGLWPVVKAALILAGQQVSDEGGALRLPNLPLTEEAGRDPLLSFVSQKDSGLIRLGQVGPAWLIAQIARTWPQHRIQVVVTRERHIYRLVKQLLHLKIEAVAVTRRRTCEPKRVGTTKIW